jgi:putative ATPase
VKDDFLPEKIKGHTFYEPGSNQRENEIRKKLSEMWNGIYNYDQPDS